jgi:hypothetical protein
MLGLPPVPSGDVAFLWYEVYSGLARITYVARDPIVGIVEPMKPAVEGAGPGRREQIGRRQSKGQGLTAYQ